MRLLILGGTTEASILVRRIAGRRDINAVLSFAGRTRSPTPPPIPFRIGGFGGVAGLTTYLIERKTDAVIDATHPFAVQMSRNAAAACHDLGLPLAVLTRPPWRRTQDDRWTSVADMAAAVRALGGQPRTVFLTVGSLGLAAFADAPQHRYIVRTIDPPDAIGILLSHCLIVARGPFSLENEITLMRDARVEVLVTKNSGGTATEAKLAAARALGIDVIIIERPAPEPVPAFEAVEDILTWIDAHRPTP
ncbi:cobalt-precorrin-6A reductase [Rhodopila sp.]|uniref:cobalt-precorrin-6A reductase n=1 Tax=Rhodopila sp. TaxID=2480087 RepID=UPI003D10BC4B